MSDPWAGTRDIPVYEQRMAMLLERYESRGRGSGLYQVFPRVQELLADADALWAVKEAAKEWQELRGKLIYDSEIKLGKALDALPEYLKGESDE